MKLTAKETVLFGLLGALMYASKIIMEALPNIHFLGVLIAVLTVVYRKKALYPIYVFVFITGLFGGFALWWVPYLYVWTALWGAVMLLPQNINPKIAPIVYMTVCGLHGLLFGVLYAPAQALFFGLSLKGTLSWIAAGFYFDVIHGISNFFCGILTVPLANMLKKADRYIR